ncbi:MAG: phosphate ABC transporter permease PstA [Rubrivivax sp.]
MNPPGRPKGEVRKAQPEGSPVSAVTGVPIRTTQGDAGRHAMHRRRQHINTVALALSLGAMAFGVFWLVWILFETVRLGASGLSLALFTQSTPAPLADGGGLANAIYGSAMMVGLATLIGTPVGIMTGIYLGEYGQKTALGSVTRFINDILLSAPSIVIGLFIYAVVVAPLKGFSAWAGVLALALIVIPVVIRTTENMLTLIPHALREAAYALGTPKWKVIVLVTLKAARSGVVTGVLLALARIAGETAPLLFTALSNQFWTSDLTKPMASLPVTIFKFALSPYENWQQLAWAGVFLITLGVLVLNITARVLFKPPQ